MDESLVRGDEHNPEDERLDESLRPQSLAEMIGQQRLRENLAILRGGDPAKLLDAAYSVGDSIGGMSPSRPFSAASGSTAATAS